jgi:hypothetical protein
VLVKREARVESLPTVLRYYGTTVLRYYGTTVLRYYGNRKKKEKRAYATYGKHEQRSFVVGKGTPTTTVGREAAGAALPPLGCAIRGCCVKREHKVSR